MLGSIALAGCRIERTPEQYIDNQASRTDALLAARDDLAVRITSLGPALARGPAAVDSILAPREGISALGPAPGQRIESSRELIDLLIGLPAGRALTADRVEVTVAPGIVYAPPEAGFRVSGVFLRENSVWRLVQAHVSRPVAGATAP